MNVRNLFTDNDAVSPVIGVILMVAITVILAAVIGAFVLNIGGSQDTTPQVSFEIETNANGGSSEWINITHGGGDKVTNSNTDVKVAGNLVWNDGADASHSSVSSISGWSGEITAGDTLNINSDVDDTWTNGDEIDIIWQSPNSDDTSIISSGTFG